LRKQTLAAIMLTMISFVSVNSSCSNDRYPGKTETLTIAAVPTELNALIYIAQDQNLFTKNGLEITLKDYDSGATAVAGILNGEADIALAAEFPIVRQVFNKKDIINFGTIAKYENTYILWRTDSGINSVHDLKGKKIGVTLTTISEFYLGRTLELNGLNIQQVSLVDTKAADSEKALVSKEVDAVVTWEPWVNQIKQLLGEEVTTRAAQSAQYAYWNLVSTSEWANSHTDVIERLIKSLAGAEHYINRHRDVAKAIIIKRMNFDNLYLDTIWPRYQFSMSLDQSLITAMEDEARWMISNKLTSEIAMPHFVDNIYEDILKKIKPEAVNIIR